MYPVLSTLQIRSPSRRQGGGYCDCDDVIALVARQKKLPIRLLTHQRRGRLPVARARQLAMYLSHVVLGRTLMDIGEAFGRDRTTVSYACALIEDMRDDRHFDDEVTALERQIETAMAQAEVMHHAA
jgi:chromosomal replication initiation ATPase DnaA